MDNDMCILGWIMFFICFVIIVFLAVKLDKYEFNEKASKYCNGLDYEILPVLSEKGRDVIGYSCCKETKENFYNSKTGEMEYTKDKNCVFKPIINS